MPVLARGKLHIELLGSEFPGDKVEAMPEFVEKLKKASADLLAEKKRLHRSVDKCEAALRDPKKLTNLCGDKKLMGQHKCWC